MEDDILTVLKSLEKWRESKPSPQTRVPTIFWKQFKDLHSKYPNEPLDCYPIH